MREATLCQAGNRRFDGAVLTPEVRCHDQKAPRGLSPNQSVWTESGSGRRNKIEREKKKKKKAPERAVGTDWAHNGQEE